MSKVIFEGWRVEDDSSHVRHRPGDGIHASSEEFVRMSPQSRFETEILYEKVQQHMDWYNNVPTPFISAYGDEGRAVQEAERRVRAGKRKVAILTIVVRESHGVTFRKMKKLFDDVFEEEVPDFVGNNAEHEAFLELLERLREVALQDAALLVDVWSEHPLFQYRVFRNIEFKTFAEDVRWTCTTHHTKTFATINLSQADGF
ncbi:hypothetical protein F5Y16DRAFT_406904 [Xylariaceae sp. FL0255]|nr:hypothetical protein F5Y16DRAFT_406904 [Xylariaceae sp. FL0255]